MIDVNTQSSSFNDLLQSYGLQQHVTGSTHIHGYTLDLLISRNLDAKTISNLKVIGGISDHPAILCDLPLSKPKSGLKTITYRNLQSIELLKFADDLHKKEFSRQLLTSTPSFLKPRTNMLLLSPKLSVSGLTPAGTTRT